MQDEKKLLRAQRRAERMAKAKMLNPELLHVTDVAEMTGYAPAYIYNMVNKGLIPYYKPNGGPIHFLKSEILAWFNGRQAKRTDNI